jgi:hypothetical protein
MAKGTASRPLIVGAVLVSVVWVVVAAVAPHDGTRWGLILRLVPVLLALVALAGSIVALLVRRPPPAAFLVRDGSAFVVPANRLLGYFTVVEVLMTGYVVSLAIYWWTDRAAGVGPTGLGYALAAVMTLLALALGALVVVLTVIAWRGRPSIELRPRTVELRDAFGSQTIPWEALRPGLPPRQADRHNLTLTVDRPDLVVRRGLTWHMPRMSLTYARVHPWFLGDAIRFYADHPERREAIGTPAEHERLLADLGAGAHHG